MSSKSSSTSSATAMSKHLKEPRPQDVLCGRGRPIREHNGNIRYNKMIQDMRREYEDAPNGRKLDVVKRLIDTIRADQGRFLYKKGDSWLELEADKVIVKTSQAFRDLRTDDSNQMNAHVNASTNANSQSNRASKKFDYNDLKKRAPAGRFASLLHRRRESSSTQLAARSTTSSPSSAALSSPSAPTSGDEDIDKTKNSNARPGANKDQRESDRQSACDDSETESEHSFPPIHS